jgi:hypothetical protein
VIVMVLSCDWDGYLYIYQSSDSQQPWRDFMIMSTAGSASRNCRYCKVDTRDKHLSDMTKSCKQK